MKHWDLYPRESVVLSSASGEIVAGRFEFRDTRQAAFLVLCEDGEDHLQFFDLAEDGDLRRRAPNGITKKWTIHGGERGTRRTWDLVEDRWSGGAP